VENLLEKLLLEGEIPKIQDSNFKFKIENPKIK
jgi:hypothetical protein